MKQLFLARLFQLKRILLFAILYYLSSEMLFAGAEQKRDSLLQVLESLKKTKTELRGNKGSIHDSSEVKVINQLANLLITTDRKSSIAYAEMANQISQQIGFLPGEQAAQSILGTLKMNEGDYVTARSHFSLAHDIATRINKPSAQAIALKKKAITYIYEANQPEALRNLLAAIKIEEANKDSLGIANTFHNIAVVFENSKDFKQAIEYYSKAISIYEKYKLEGPLGNVYCNLGLIYGEMGEFDKGLEYQFRALRIFEKDEDLSGIAESQNRIGIIKEHQGKLSEAFDYYMAALKLYEQTGEQFRIAQEHHQLGSVYLKQKKFEKAELSFQKTLSIMKTIGALSGIRDTYFSLALLDSIRGNMLGAFLNYKMGIAFRDSIQNDEKAKQITQMQMQAEYDRKEMIAREKQLEKDRVNTWTRNSLISGMSALLVFGGIMFNRFRVTRKQRNVIAMQKIESDRRGRLIELKNLEITQSIEYALRIQNAILPSLSLVHESFQESFILYKPKDIVAGDFYWLEQVGDVVLFAVCDCTGHGVPGAMVSVICNNALNRAVREFGLLEPASILDKTASLVIENFKGSTEEIKDGMDISLCVFNKKAKRLEWAGANNPLWIIKGSGLEEFKGDKQPIGMSDSRKPFTNHVIPYDTEATLYLFTDGYPDQFSGTGRQKKLTKRGFKELLLTVQQIPVKEQNQELDKFIETHKGESDQIDDILVMGVRL